MFVSLLLASGIYIVILHVRLLFYSYRFKNIFLVIIDICMHVCKMYEIFNRIFTITAYALRYLSNIPVKFVIMPLVLLIDHGFIPEVEHCEPPNHKRKLDYGNLSDFHYGAKCSNFSPYTCESRVDC